MAHVSFTGHAMTFTFNSKALTGVQEITIDDAGAPNAEQLDKTCAGDTTYTFLADPLGAKGPKKATVTVKGQDSYASYADATMKKFAFNDPRAATADLAPGVTNGQTYTHSTLQLLERTTEVLYDNWATYTLVFGANALGAWSGPA